MQISPLVSEMHWASYCIVWLIRCITFSVLHITHELCLEGLCCAHQVRRPLRVEQSHHLYTQHSQWAEVDRALRRNHHQEHQKHLLHLQANVRQGTSQSDGSISHWCSISRELWPALNSSSTFHCFMKSDNAVPILTAALRVQYKWKWMRCRSRACSYLLVAVSQGNYWSSNVNEVQGFIMDQEGKVVHRLFGKWHEGVYCGVPPSAKCIWRPGTIEALGTNRPEPSPMQCITAYPLGHALLHEPHQLHTHF